MRRHDGRGRDPFVQPKGSTPEKAQALESVARRPTAVAARRRRRRRATRRPGTAGGDASPSSEPKSSKPKSTAPTYTVDLRFGQADSMKTLRDVERLTPLPSASSPFFVFLGAKDGGKTLVFLVSSDAKATGDGTCKPSKSACETIELQAGDTEFFDLTTADGVQQYQMDIIKIEKTTTSSVARSSKSARAAQGRASKADRRLLRKVLDGRAAHLMGSYRWDARRGVLVHVRAWDDEDPPATSSTTRRTTCRSPAPAPTDGSAGLARRGRIPCARAHGAQAHHRRRVARPRTHLRSSRACRRASSSTARRIDRDMARRQLGHGRGGRMKIETDARRGPLRASATGARSAARSRCRSPTATTPTGTSG